MDELKVITPTAGLGYGFPEKSIEAGMKKEPDLIAVDSGSSDPGPYYLGAAASVLSWTAQERDLEILLRAREEAGIPLIVGTAATAGSSLQVDKTIELVKTIAKRRGYHFKLARIGADIDKAYLKNALKENRVRTFEHPCDLTEEAIDQSQRIVGQMGMEPFIEALKMNTDVIIAGRAYDPATVAAMPIMQGFDTGLAVHMGKILECGAYAAEPSAATDCMLGTIRNDHFIVEPLNPNLRCTINSVGAHTLYEKDSPLELHLPGGKINLKSTTFEQIGDRLVRVKGTEFTKADIYTVKLEGAARVGYRSLFIAGARDPAFISQIDNITQHVRDSVAKGLPYSQDDYQLVFRIYGKNGTMQQDEPVTKINGHELGIIGETVARTQKIAHDVCSFAHGSMLHYHYEGRKSVAGNLAFPYSPSDFDLGEVFEFNIYHLLEIDDPTKLFPVSIEQI